MRTRCWFAVIGLVLAVLAAGCADTGDTSDQHARDGVYGGVSAGGARP